MAKSRSRTGEAVTTAADRSSRKPTDAAASVTEHDIARRAYFLYLGRDREPGHDVDDWLQAERDLRRTAGSTVL
jgi:hypothetical protein